MEAKHFMAKEDEAAYLAWLGANPDGLVLNAYRKPTPTYLVLHKVGTRCLRHPNPTKDYSKLCGSRAEIADHLMRRFGISPTLIRECSSCFRRHGEYSA